MKQTCLLVFCFSGCLGGCAIGSLKMYLIGMGGLRLFANVLPFYPLRYLATSHRPSISFQAAF